MAKCTVCGMVGAGCTHLSSNIASAPGWHLLPLGKWSISLGPFLASLNPHTCSQQSLLWWQWAYLAFWAFTLLLLLPLLTWNRNGMLPETSGRYCPRLGSCKNSTSPLYPSIQPASAEHSMFDSQEWCYGCYVYGMFINITGQQQNSREMPDSDND